MATTVILQCIDKTLGPVNIPKITSGGREDITLNVRFDATWDGFAKTATFYRDKTLVHHATMVGQSCTLPWVIAFEPGILYVGVFGVRGDEVKTTEVLALDLAQGAPTGSSVHDPIPDIYKQLLNAYAKVTTAQAVESARLDEVLSGSTASDSELVDVRVGADGKTYGSAGAAVRAQVDAMNETLEAALPISAKNLFDPFAAQKDMALHDADGESFSDTAYWLTNVMTVSVVQGVVSNAHPYKIIWYDTNMHLLKTNGSLNRGQSYAKPDGAVYAIMQFEESVTPFQSRFDIVICDTAVNLTDVPTLGQWFNRHTSDDDEILNLFDVDDRNLLNPLKCLPGMCFASISGERYSNASFWTSDYIPVNGVSGLQSNVGIYKVGWYDINRAILGTGLVAPDGAEYALIQFEESKVPYASRFDVVVCDSTIKLEGIRSHYYAPMPGAADTVESFGDPLFEIKLKGASYMSDHTFINGQLYALNASADDHRDYANVTVYDVDPVAGTSAYVRSFKHNLGHGNSIDYCAGNGCLILGNGSGDPYLPGKIFILPDAANRSTWEYTDCIKIDLSNEKWGIKTNVVWGEHNNGEYNIAYVITNNNANVHKIMLTKVNGVFDGGYIVLGEWSTDVIDVNQGTVYRDGKLYIAVGHSQVWALEYTLNTDGTITVRQLKDVFYDSNGAERSTPFAEGITIENGLIYFGSSDGRVLVYGTRAPQSTVDVEGEVPEDIMLRRYYDANNNGVVDDAEKLGGLPPEAFSKADHNHTADQLDGYDGLFIIAGNPVTHTLKAGRGISAVTTLRPIQSGSGDPSPDNLRAISGRTELKLTRGGKNFISAPGSVELRNATYSYDAAGGTFTLTKGAESVWGQIIFKLEMDAAQFAGRKLTLSCTDASSTYAGDEPRIYVMRQDKNTTINRMSLSAGANSMTFTVPQGVTALYLIIRIDQNKTAPEGTVLTVRGLQLEDGYAATEFEPYASNTFSVEFGRTVYGGSMDWLTGELTVTHGMIGTYAGESLPGAWISDRDVYAPGASPTTGAQVVYELAKPDVIQLTPRMFAALSGVNTLYTDGGSNEFTFNHDRALVFLMGKLTV